MDSENKRNFQLKWPWNWVICGLFILGAWSFLGIFGVGLVTLFFHVQKKRHPDAVPQGGYCLDRTRKQIARLGWSLFYLTVAFTCGAVFVMQLREDRCAWELEDWAILAVSGAIALGAALLGVCETYAGLRDVFCPAKSRLAKSIRSQLPYPDEAPDWPELFAMVDRDIQENGIWFDRAAVGREWVLGDEAMSIPRIRGVFARNELKLHVTGSRRRTARIVQLWLVDNRKQTQCTGLRSPSELDMAVKCLRLRCPEAYFSEYSRMSDFLNKTEDAWQAMERDYRLRRDRRLAREAEQQQESAALPKIQGTVRLAREAVAAQFAGLKEQLKAEEESRSLPFRLTILERSGASREYRAPTSRDVELAARGLADGGCAAVCLRGAADYIYLRAGTAQDGRVTVNVGRPGPDRLRVYETKCACRQAERYLTDWAAGLFSEDLSKWKDITKKLERQSKK